MGAAFKLKKGDRLPALRAVLKNGNTPIDLTAATGVAFRMRAVGQTALKVSGEATIVDAAGGVVSYAWAAQDTDTAGDFDAEFVATFSNGDQTVPGDGFVRVTVTPSLA